MKQKHYMDIERLNPFIAEGFSKGDDVVIQEKIDGANFSIRYDPETNTVKAFSRKNELSSANGLRGAWLWSQNLSVDIVHSVLGEDKILFAEWLVKHSVPYPKERYNNAYCYDVYDTSSCMYLPQDDVERIVSELGLIYVPVFYKGKFTSWDDVMKYVGVTQLGGEFGEGIVIKNQSRLASNDERIPFYTKIVADKFKETKGQSHKRVIDPEKENAFRAASEITETIVTRARVEKLMHKLVDEGIIPESWNAKDMGTIAKNICKNVIDDCVKEEMDTVNAAGPMFTKIASSMTMHIVREMLNERNMI